MDAEFGILVGGSRVVYLDRRGEAWSSDRTGARVRCRGRLQARGGISCLLTPFRNGAARPAAGVGGPHRIDPQEQTTGHDQEQREPAVAPAGAGVPLSRAAAWRCDNKDERTGREKQGSSRDPASIDRAASLASCGRKSQSTGSLGPAQHLPSNRAIEIAAPDV